MSGDAAPAGRYARVIRQDVRSMHAYAIQDSAGLVKLDAMENPFRLPEALQRELGRRLGAVAINRYPTRCVGDVIAALAKYVDLPAGCKLMLGNGSDELISLLALACDIPGATILAPRARLRDVRDVGAAAGPEVRRRAADRELRARRRGDAGGDRRRTARRSPTSPTPTTRPRTCSTRARSSASSPPSARRTGWSSSTRPTSRSRRGRGWRRSGSLPHVLVLRTLSKFGLAGVRLGYLAGPAALIDEVDKVRPPYNIGALNAEATLFALEHASEFARQAALLRGERARLQRELAATPGVTAFPSEANMILVRVPGAAKVFQGMKSRGVLVKNVEGLHPLLADCLRLTVGTAEENTLMIDALRASLR